MSKKKGVELLLCVLFNQMVYFVEFPAINC